MSEAYLWFFFVIYELKNHKTGSESECEPIVDIFGIALKDNDCKQYVRHIMGSEMACLGFMVLQIQNEWHKPCFARSTKKEAAVGV